MTNKLQHMPHTTLDNNTLELATCHLFLDHMGLAITTFHDVSVRQFGLEKLHAWLEPILIKAVTTMSEAYCSELTRKTTEATEELKRHVQVLTLRNDELEQYTRRDNVKIHGLPESDNEDTIEQVVQLAKKAGVVIDAMTSALRIDSLGTTTQTSRAPSSRRLCGESSEQT